MQIANYQLHIVETGRFGLDGGAMFGVVPKVLWNRTNPADEKNRISLAMRTLLLVGEGRVILIDTGVGDYWPQKFCNIYAIDHHHSSLTLSLQKLGYTPQDVTDVIVTHLHFDHVGGAVRLDGEQHVPLFNNAKYHVQKNNLQHAQNPLEKDRASYLAETFMPLVDQNLIQIANGEKELLPNIHVLPVDGHTIGQQMVKISDNSNTLLYCADLIPTSSHIPIPYVMAYDLSPVKTIEEKKKYLQLACDNNWLLYFEHDPQTVAATVTKNTKGFIVDKIISDFSQGENMPLVISILCCLQIIGGISLMIVAAYSYKTLQFSVEKINLIAQKLSQKMNEKYEKGEPITSKKPLSKEEMDKIKGYLEYLGDNVKLQITMSFLSLYFIGAKITSRPVVPLFSTFIFAIVNICCGFMLLYGGEQGWYLGICACVYALLRNLHALALLPKLTKTLSHTIFKVNQFYIKYIIRSCVLIVLIFYFFSSEIMHYFSMEETTIDILILVETAAIGFVALDFLCYKMQEWTVDPANGEY